MRRLKALRLWVNWLPGGRYSPLENTSSGTSLAAVLRGRWYRSWYCLAVGVVLLATITTALVAVHSVNADPSIPLLSPYSSCATLAGADRTATNGSTWGETVLPGFGQPGGWFGVPVCANGINPASDDGSSVSCDRIPSNWSRSGCAPGQPTSDGFGWTFQCPELIVRFSAWAFGDSPSEWGGSGWGNAPDLWLPVNHPSDFVMYPNGSTVAPVPGDILIWGSLNSKGQPWPAGPDGEHGGHIAVVAAVTNGMVITAEQNVKWGTQDHPSDELALTKVGDSWILSGTTAHQTTLPTYRWPSTMGDSRGTYGWLHSVRNTGQFPSSSRAAGARANARGSTVPQQPSGGYPSLEPAAVVTGNGQLADLVWSSSDFFAPSANSDVPHAELRSLGAPPGALLVPGQRPASISSANGSRLTYVVGTDGHLYSALITPTTLGVVWTDLGNPAPVRLEGASLSAAIYAGGTGVLALGSDGNLWWRAGPSGQLGSWQQIGKPAGAELGGGFMLAGAPGEGTPLILATTKSGRLDERVWEDAQFAANGSVQVPAGWSDWSSLSMQPKNVAFSESSIALAELPDAPNYDYVGAWPDTPLDIWILDTEGHLWWMRMSSLQTGWRITSVATPTAMTGLLGGAVVAGMPSKSNPQQVTEAVQLYTTSSNQAHMLTLSLPLNASAPAATGAWTLLSALPAQTGSAGVAVPLGQEASVLVIADGTRVLIGGSQASTFLLLPSTVSDQTAPASGLKWLTVGSVSTEAAFADTLLDRAVDPRWTLSGAHAQLEPSRAGLRLLPTSDGIGALMQTAEGGDFTLSVYVVLPAKASGQAGLVLYTDDNDWLTVLADPSGQVSLCGRAWQAPVPCKTTTLSASSLRHGIWLQVTRRGNTFSAEVSLDAVAWRVIGAWSPSSTGTSTNWTVNSTSPTPSPTIGQRPEATPAATDVPTGGPSTSLAFTSWGILAEGSFDNLSAPMFSDFSIVTGSPGAGGAMA